jgi:hypothetical protein
MNPVWLGVVIAGAGVAALLYRRFLSNSHHKSIDVGTVSESWLSEQRAGKRDDRFSS